MANFSYPHISYFCHFCAQVSVLFLFVILSEIATILPLAGTSASSVSLLMKMTISPLLQ